VSKTIQRLRDEITEMSLKLLSHINQRTERVLQIAEEKRRLNLPTRDPQRESTLLDLLVAENQGPMTDASVRSLFQRIFDVSVEIQDESIKNRLRVAKGSGPRIEVSVAAQVIGGGLPQYIAGPCAVENAEQMETVAAGLRTLGVRILRGGAFKPRTSPYTFQGLGEPGLKLLSEAAKRHQLVSVSEATSPGNANLVARYVDIIQIGARNMYNYDLLRATLDEWLHAAEHIALAGSAERAVSIDPEYRERVLAMYRDLFQDMQEGSFFDSVRPRDFVEVARLTRSVVKDTVAQLIGQAGR